MKKICLMLLLAAMVCVPAKLSAQVTIGSGAEPSQWSLLYLDASEQRKALHNARLTYNEREALVPPVTEQTPRREAERGLMIFNTDNNCLEYWNGERWVSLCIGDTPNVRPTLNCEQGNFPIPQFAHFNLGGKQFETARAQMQYAATFTGNFTTTSNGSIFGGRFQWGRVDMEHAISTDGNFTLWSSGGNAVTWSDAINYDSNSGQPTGSAATQFILTPGVGQPNNWFRPPATVLIPHNSLWGNGVDIGTVTPDGGVPFNGQTYQSTSWVLPQNDPCREHLGAGWRVPTQDEWERIGAYDCDPTGVHTSRFSTSVNGTVPPTDNNISPFTWVPVRCGGANPGAGVCRPSSAWNETGINGYVIYRTKDWQNMSEAQRENLLADGTPEPFLFLPAAGWRIGGSGLVNVTATGWYWSSTVSSNNNTVDVRVLYLGHNSVEKFSVNIGRSNGFSIRCVRN